MAAEDRNAAQVDMPHSHAFVVTPHDTNDLAFSTRALYIGVTGDVKVNMVGGEAGITFKAVPVGVLPIRATLVASTGTTATNIVGLY